MSIYQDAEEIKKKLQKSDETKVKVALFGQSGAGKSSIIKAYIGEDSPKSPEISIYNDTTIEAEEYEWNNIIFVDLPGYGTAKFPKSGFLKEFKIEEFDLILCVYTGKLNETDIDFFKQMKASGKTCLFVYSKHDALKDKTKTKNELMQEVQHNFNMQLAVNEKLYFTSSIEDYGFDELSTAIASKLDKSKQERWIRGAKAHSEEDLKKKLVEAEMLLISYAGVSAGSAVIPIPGVGVAADIAVLMTLFSQIKKIFGLTEAKIDKYKDLLPKIAPLADNVIKYATEKGIALLLKQFAGGEIIKEIAKYIPLVGSVIAASAGFAITYQAGKSYMNDCYKVAEEILKSELNDRKI